jgi:nucleotide-binding universal stress UspA family protein
MINVSDSSLVVRNIAIATDFSPWSNRAMQHALVVAHRFGAILHFVHTVRRSEFAFVPDLMAPLDEVAERDCENLMAILHAAHSLDGIEHRCWNLCGECSAMFGDFVRDQKIDLMVVGTRGRSGILKFLLGSIAEEISHCVPCPVLEVGPGSRDATVQLEVKKVLFATDLSAESAAAIPYVLTAAKTWGSEIDVLQLGVSLSSKRQHLTEEFIHKMQVSAGIQQHFSLRYHIESGAPSATVLKFARQNKDDLIVLGHEHHGSPISEAYEIVRQSTCPVLRIRSGSR